MKDKTTRRRACEFSVGPKVKLKCWNVKKTSSRQRSLENSTLPDIVDETLVLLGRVTKAGGIVLQDLKLDNKDAIWSVAQVSKIHSL